MINNATVAEFDQSLEDYEKAFHKFVDAHDKYMLYVTIHGKTRNKVIARAQHTSTLKQ